MDALSPDDAHEIAGYRLRARLGEGGMGMVYLSHTRGGQPVALKVVRREYAQDPEFRKRFSQEVTAARRVQGPYTAPVLDSFTEGPEPWLAIGYVPGPSLASAVYQHGRLPLRTVLQLTAGIAEALQTIHAAGVIHRDLKPSNVLLASDGPRVIDFGIARAADTTALTGTDVRLGTPAYMAPEQAMGGDVTPVLDVFALGLVAFFAATGRHPFGEGASHALLYRIVSNEPDLDACPDELRGVIAGCLAKDPRARPTPEQIIEACNTLAGTGGLIRHEGWWLPPAVQEQISRQEETLRLHSSSTPAAAGPSPTPPVPTQPGLPPQAAFAAAVPTRPAHSPADAFVAAAPTAPAYSPQSAPVPGAAGSDRPAKPRRTPLIAVIAVVAALAVGGGSVAAYQVLTNDSRDTTASGDTQSASGGADPAAGAAAPSSAAPTSTDGPKSEAGWQISARDKDLVLRAPKYTPTAEDIGSGTMCRPSDATILDINDLSVETGAGYIPSSGGWLTYTDCPEPIKVNGIRLADDEGSFSTTTERRPTPTACRDSALGGTLPNPIPLSRIRNDSVLRTGTGLCLVSGEGTVTHLWITKVNAGTDDNDQLRTYVATATQWKPE
ncbi:protein kinase [Streptomyces violaceus]|uniref:Protein kinase n=1 Tax=Streptomyces violaceus TaxID=1936 RepID=A0ABZ1NX31_STRVL|nr:protein kinase [Streptomyces violaceus]